MSKLVKTDISQSIGQSVFDDLYLGKSRYYYSIGRSYPWDSSDLPSEIIISEAQEKLVRRDSILYKRINGTDISFVIPRVDYQKDIVYDIYDDAIDMSDKNYYVMNSNYNIYKCLYNNNGSESTVEPYGSTVYPIKYSDGYEWQFVYSIPPALRTKFLTVSYIPVYNAITERYYSRGSINSVIIDAMGTGYTQNNTTISVSGDGYLESNPYKITNLNITYPGSGYTTTPTVETNDIFNPNTNFSTGAPVVSGEYLKVSDVNGVRFYYVETPGILGAVPTHYFTSVVNGTATLKHVGTKPKITATIDNQTVGGINVTDPGFGYLTTPNATKDAPGAGASLSVNLVNGSVSAITVLSVGSGYTSTDVTIDSPRPSSVLYTFNRTCTTGEILHYTISGSTYFYQVDSNGVTDSSTPPSHISGSQVNGTVLMTVIAKQAKATAILGTVNGVTLYGDVSEINIINEGSGYTTASVAFTGGSPVQPATANAIISSGKIVKIQITFPGYGYQTAPSVNITGDGIGASATPILNYGYGYQGKPTITFSDPNNVLGVKPVVDTNIIKTNAKLKPIIENGNVRGIQIIDAGVGYTTADILVQGDGTGAKLTPLFASGDLSSIQAQTELSAIPGSISSIKVITGGSNITSLSITIEGDGTGATLQHTLLNGSLIEVKVIDHGSNYTYANLVINAVGINVIPPTIRAILSPSKGHASNPLKELKTKSILLHTVFSKETNQGFTLDNQFRQISIIKNPLKYNSDYILNDKTVTSCHAIKVNTSLIPFEKNGIVLNTNNSTQYRVIDFNSSELLLQSLVGSSLSIGDILNFNINSNVYSATVVDTVDPTIDKYSGEILYIQNNKYFTPTEEQAVAINTIINLI